MPRIWHFGHQRRAVVGADVSRVATHDEQVAQDIDDVGRGEVPLNRDRQALVVETCRIEIRLEGEPSLAPNSHILALLFAGVGCLAIGQAAAQCRVSGKPRNALIAPLAREQLLFDPDRELHWLLLRVGFRRDLRQVRFGGVDARLGLLPIVSHPWLDLGPDQFRRFLLNARIGDQTLRGMKTVGCE